MDLVLRVAKRRDGEEARGREHRATRAAAMIGARVMPPLAVVVAFAILAALLAPGTTQLPHELTHAVTERTEFPQASRVVRPASSSRSMSASTSVIFTKWSCTFCRVVT